jgi:glycosyltransferase involved in cell wall biosynthesis
VEVELVRAEEKIWPGWALRPVEVLEAYFQRREQEWALADCIVVNSRWSFDALVKQGVPASKLVVIPLCFETGEVDPQPAMRNLPSGSPLRVLFLGQVILRKGIQYLLTAAKKLGGIHFDIVGPVGISAEAVASAPRNVTFHGRASRDQAANWYRQSHIFVLPTLSDGFAITQLEAMAHGLPVVVTDCCGEVVTNGKDGFVVPSRNADALAEIFQRYLSQPDLLAAQREAALQKSKQFTLSRLAENLLKLEGELAK